MGKIISIANQKGGVGKTTTAFNLGRALHRLDFTVLLVDNDSQCNLTSYASVESGSEICIEDFYISRRKPLASDELLYIERGFALVPADLGLTGAEYHLVNRADNQYVLKNALSEVSPNFDFVIIDNPPALSLLTVNGLVASDGVLVPVQLEYFSLEGIVALQRTIKNLNTFNPQLRLYGIIPSMFNGRRKLSWEVLEALQKEFGSQLLETKINENVKIAESSGHGRSILDYAPQSKSSTEFLNLAKEVAEIE